MGSGKRERNKSEHITEAERATKKNKSAEEHPHGEVDYEREYKARAIIGEKGGKYLIDWEDDPVTGEQYEPTWEPKRNANQLLIDDWNKRKAAASVSASTPKKGRGRPKKAASPPSARQPPRKRPRRVIESSPDPPSQVLPEPEPEIQESQPQTVSGAERDVDGPLFVSPDNSVTSEVLRTGEVEVQISDPPSSFAAGAYQRFSSPTRSIPESTQASAEVAASSVEEVVVQQERISQGNSSGETRSARRVVPDSQDLELEDSTFRGFSPDPTQRAATSAASVQSPVLGQQETSSASEPVVPEVVAGLSDQETSPQSEQQNSSSLPASNSAEPATTAEEAGGLQSSEQSKSQDQGTSVVPPESSDQSERRAPPAVDKESHSDSQRTDSAEPSQEHVASQPEDIRTEDEGEASPRPEQVNTSSENSNTTKLQPAAQSTSSSFENDRQVRYDLPRQETFAEGTSQPRSVPQPLSQQSIQASRSSKHADQIPHDSSGQQESVGGFPQRESQPDAQARSNDATSSEDIVGERQKFPVRDAPIADNSQPQPQTQDRSREAIVIEDTPTSYIGHFLTQASDYQVPPGAQREPPSSAHVTPGAHLFQQESQESPPASSRAQPSQAETISSTPFQTQIGFSIRPSTEVFKQDNSPVRPSSSSLFRSQLNGAPQSFPSIPAYSLPVVGESAPPALESLSSIRTVTPVKLHMDSSSMPTPKTGSESLSAKLKAMRERNSARLSQTPARQIEQPASSLPPNIAAEVAIARASPVPHLQDGTRSPSAVPAMEHEPPISKEEMNTSERYETLLPQAQTESSDLQGRSNGAATPAKPREAIEDPEIANVHVIPVSLANHQGDQYRSNIYYHQEVIDQFLDDRNPSSELLADAERVVERLRQIAIHPDLVNIETLSQTSEPELQKQWDVDCSGKFRFLDQFLSNLKDLNRHVAIVTVGDRVPDMLETFLKGSHIPYSRGGGLPSRHTTEDGPRVSIVEIDSTPENAVASADIVIALDGSMDSRHPLIRKARRHEQRDAMSQTNSWAMLLMLVAPHTIEHIERCISTNLSPKVKARVLLNATMRVRGEAGKLEDGQFSPKETASILAEFLDDPDPDNEWPLAGLSQIQDLDSQTETELDQSSHDLSSANTGDKRPLESTGIASPDGAMKRPRIDDGSQIPATINPQDLEVTHISDSLGKGTQTIVDFSGYAPTATELELREVLEQVQDRMEGYVSALEDLQYRHETQHKELITRTKERDDLISRMQQAVERMTLTETLNTTYKAERAELKTKLTEANDALLNHSVPERAELEAVRLAAEQANLDKTKAEKKVESVQKDLDWTRSMYQDSSNRARELAEQNTSLETQLAAAQKLASGAQARVKQLSQDTRNKALERENARLKVMLKEREAGMKFKDEEIARLKESGRGRMGTRQSSVPRSPRLGSPMKMGRGSRQASPAVGEGGGGGGRGRHLHPLRQG